MNIQIDFIRPVLFFLGLGYAVSYYTKKDIGFVFPFLFMGSSLYLYFFSLLNILSVGFYSLVFLGIVLSIGALFQSKGKNTYFYTHSLAAIVGILLIVVFMNQQRFYYQWDEFSHWGMMIKEMMRLNQLYTVDASHLVNHRDYPPMIQLFQYLWLKLAGYYHEPLVYQSLQLLGLSLFIPAISTPKRRGFRVIFIVFSLLLMVIYQGVFDLEDAKFFMTVYLDPILGLLFAFQVYLALIHETSFWNKWSWILAGSFLLLTKEMGLVFYGFASILLVYNSWKQQTLKSTLKTLIIPLLLYFTWPIYFSQFKYVGQFDVNTVHLGQFFEIILGKGGLDWQINAYHNFLRALTSMPILTTPIKLNYIQMSFVMLSLFLIISNFIPKKMRWDFRVIGILLFIFSYVYALVLLVLYCFSFGPYEGPNLASMLRYTSTYWYAMESILIMVVYHYSEGRLRHTFSLAALSLVFIMFFYTPNSLERIKPDTTYDNFESYFSVDTQVLRTMTNENDSIYFIAQDQSANILNIFRYLVNDRVFNANGFDLGTKTSEDEVWKTDLTSNQFVDTLKNYDYVYIYHMNDEFYERYYLLFPLNFYVRDHQLIKIIKSSDSIQFEILN